MQNRARWVVPERAIIGAFGAFQGIQDSQSHSDRGVKRRAEAMNALVWARKAVTAAPKSIESAAEMMHGHFRVGVFEERQMQVNIAAIVAD